MPALEKLLADGVRRKLAQTPVDVQQQIRLYYQAGLPSTEIAKALGVSVATVLRYGRTCLPVGKT